MATRRYRCTSCCFSIVCRKLVVRLWFLMSEKLFWKFCLSCVRIHKHSGHLYLRHIKPKRDSTTWMTQKRSDSLVCCGRQWCGTFILYWKWTSQKSCLLSNAGNWCPVRSPTIPTESCPPAWWSFSHDTRCSPVFDKCFETHGLENKVPRLVSKVIWFSPSAIFPLKNREGSIALEFWAEYITA